MCFDICILYVLCTCECTHTRSDDMVYQPVHSKLQVEGIAIRGIHLIKW